MSSLSPEVELLTVKAGTSEQAATFNFPKAAVARYMAANKTGGSNEHVLAPQMQVQVNRTMKMVEQMWSVVTNANPTSLLDIGCGLAIADAIFSRYFNLKEIHLLDGDGTAPRSDGWHPEGMAAWTDVNMAAQIVRMNGSRRTTVYPHVARPDFKPAFKVDMVMSLKSWGHHYPIPIYRDLAAQVCNPGGLLILDCWDQEQASKELEIAGFRFVQEINPRNDAKGVRIALRKE